jgi:hypothetical protein
LTYGKTEGVMRQFLYIENENGTRRTEYFYPIVDFQINDSSYAFYGSTLQHDELHRGDTVPVLYDKHDPSKAYVYSALGFWAPTLAYFFPFFLLITMLFGLDYIPKVVKINF